MKAQRCDQLLGGSALEDEGGRAGFSHGGFVDGIAAKADYGGAGAPRLASGRTDRGDLNQ